jgi:opacity protein-like surface antigen
LKKLWLLCLIVLVATHLSSAATADDRDPGYYANLGASYIKVEKVSFVDTAVAAGAAALSAAEGVDFVGSIGYLYDSGLRTEFEISFRSNGVDDAIAIPDAASFAGEQETDMRALGGMVNMLYDFETASGVLPFVGGGLGVADISARNERIGWTDGDTAVAFQGLAGIEFALSGDLSLHGGYRFFATSGAAVGLSSDDYRTHNIELGLDFRF